MEIRRASLSDVEWMLASAAREGWNPGLDDATAFRAADPDGFFIGYAGNQRIACISVVNHGPGFAFLGLYIVAPDHRGRGHGKRLWDAAIAHAGDRTIGLDGVPDQQENYRRAGFVRAGTTARYTGTAPGRAHPAIGEVATDEIADLIAAEASHSGVSKPRYLQNWYRAAPHRRTHVLRSAGAIMAHATLRTCIDGYKIGPFCARTPDAAEALLDHCLAQADGPVSIDVPQSAHRLAGLCRDRGFGMGFETARMYRGPADGLPQGDLFAVSTLELG